MAEISIEELNIGDLVEFELCVEDEEGDESCITVTATVEDVESASDIFAMVEKVSGDEDAAHFNGYIVGVRVYFYFPTEFVRVIEGAAKKEDPMKGLFVLDIS